MEIEKAQVIINEAKSAGAYEGPLPEDEALAIKEAERIIEQALAAYRAGVKGDAVMTILNLSQDLDIPDKEKGDLDNRSVAATIISPNIPDDNGNASVDLVKELEPDIEKEYEEGVVGAIDPAIPIPKPPENLPELPADFTELNTLQLRRFMSAYNAAAVFTAWQLSVEENLQEAAKFLGDMLFDTIVEQVHSENADALAKVITAKTNQNPQIKLWRKRELSHKTKARTYKRTLESYERTGDRLSREWTIRSEDLKTS